MQLLFLYQNKKMKLFLFTILVVTSFAGKTQSLLTPSKKSFEKKWVKNSNYDMIWYGLKDTTKFEIGKVSTQVFSNSKTITVVTNVHLKNMKDPWVDSTIAEAETLKPIRHSSYNMQRDLVLNFGKIVTGVYNDKTKNKTSVITDTTETDYFDSNIYPVLIGWLPLENDYRQDVSIYDYNPLAKSGVIKAFIKNVSSSTYQTEKNGIKNVWVVAVSDEISNGENGSTIYYFDKTDRKLWKQEINANGRKMLMKLVE